MSSNVSQYTLTRWHKLNAEERSWVLLKSFKGGIISADQASSLTGAYTMSWYTTFAAPLALYPAFKFGLGGAFPTLARRLGSAQMRVLNLALTGTVFLAWKYTNPFNSAFLAEKEALLADVDEKIGAGMMQLNEMLPRYYTEFEVMRRIRVENQGGYLFGLLNCNGDGLSNRDALPKVNSEKWPTPSSGSLTR